MGQCFFAARAAETNWLSSLLSATRLRIAGCGCASTGAGTLAAAASPDERHLGSVDASPATHMGLLACVRRGTFRWARSAGKHDLAHSLLLGSSFGMVKACAPPYQVSARCALTPERSR